jgi:hypothetical protein
VARVGRSSITKPWNRDNDAKDAADAAGTEPTPGFLDDGGTSDDVDGVEDLEMITLSEGVPDLL